MEVINAKFTSTHISIFKSRTPRRRGIICIERDDSQASFRDGKAVRASAFNPGAFVTRVTHFTAPHAPAIPSRNVQDPRRSPLLFLLLLRYFSSYSTISSFHPSTTLAYSRGWQSVAKRQGMSQKRDKRLTLPARQLQLETWNFVENEPRIRRDNFPSTSLCSDEDNADLMVFRTDSFKGPVLISHNTIPCGLHFNCQGLRTREN